jgi:hypothetical protein
LIDRNFLLIDPEQASHVSFEKGSCGTHPSSKAIGISFSRGNQIAVTGSKVKHDAPDVILARELVKGEDTLLFRVAKGNRFGMRETANECRGKWAS